MLHAVSEESSVEVRAVLFGELSRDEGWLSGREGDHTPEELAQVVASLAIDEFRMEPQRFRPTGHDIAFVATGIAGILGVDPERAGTLALERFAEGLLNPKAPNAALVQLLDQLA